MKMQDYEYIIDRLEGIARRAERFNHSKEDLVMNLRFEADNFRQAMELEEEKMIKELMPA